MGLNTRFPREGVDRPDEQAQTQFTRIRSFLEEKETERKQNKQRAKSYVDGPGESNVTGSSLKDKSNEKSADTSWFDMKI